MTEELKIVQIDESFRIESSDMLSKMKDKPFFAVYLDGENKNVKHSQFRMSDADVVFYCQMLITKIMRENISEEPWDD